LLPSVRFSLAWPSPYVLQDVTAADAVRIAPGFEKRWRSRLPIPFPSMGPGMPRQSAMGRGFPEMTCPIAASRLANALAATGMSSGSFRFARTAAGAACGVSTGARGSHRFTGCRRGSALRCRPAHIPHAAQSSCPAGASPAAGSATFVRPHALFGSGAAFMPRETLSMEAVFDRGPAAMHDAVVAATFILMVLSPCLVALRTGVSVNSAAEEKNYD
jgi:hypothetical protein